MESLRSLFFYYSVIWKEQVNWILWERLPAAIVLTRGWKPLPQVSFSLLELAG